MKKLKLKIIISLLFILASTGGIFIFPAKAENIIDAEFENSPLFSESKILPGDSVTRWVKVSNQSEDIVNLTILVLEPTDPDNLGSKMNMQIKKGDDIIYRQPLSDFLSANSINIGSLYSGESVQLYFTVSFDIQTGNEYQLKNLGFDIAINAQSDSSGSGDGGGGYTISSYGGGGVLGSTIKPDNEKIQVPGEEGRAELSIKKEAKKEKVNPGESDIEYEVIIKNIGNITAYNVTITDQLPEGMFFSGEKSQEKEVIVGDLEPGQSGSFYFHADLNSNAQPGPYVNTVIGNADNCNQVKATAPILAEYVVVAGIELTPTGFRLLEMIGLIFSILIFITVARILKKNYLL